MDKQRKQELAKRLMATFLEELPEHVEAMNRHLLSLEKELPAEKRNVVLNELFRSAHSLKGASRIVNAEVIERTCHKMEDILDEIREGKRALGPPLFPLFFKVADGIEDAGMRLRDEQDLADSPLHELIPELERAAAVDDEPDPETIPAEEPLESAQPAAPAATSPPPAETTPPPAPPAVDESDVTAATAVAETSRMPSAPASSSIRVAAEKLDALLAQNGELLVARRRIEQRSTDAEGLTESIVALRAEWNQLAKPLQRLFDEDGNGLREAGTRYQLPRRAEAILMGSGERLAQLEKQAERLAASMTADARVLRQTCDALDEEVYTVRMLPFIEACGGLERAVRDIAQLTSKSVGLVIEGQDVEVDRSVLEGLKDPLLHLVRNAVDHGIESPVDRELSKKESRGSITVSAALRGGHVEVVVKDDGRGFDLQRIREKGQQRGLALPQDEAEQARMVFLPGFSTAAMVTDVSGRGVGLDVVESAVQALHGSIDVDFETGAGSRFTITVPLTLTTVRCVLVNAAEQTYAIPTSMVQQIVRFDAESVRTMSGRDVLLLGGSPTPVASLAQVLGQGTSARDTGSNKVLAVVVGTSDQRAALVVDELSAEQEVLVKNLGARIRYARHISGATLLPSGRVALVLNVANVLSTALGRATRTDFGSERSLPAEPSQRRLLVVEDSVTTRTLMKGILETAGYHVTSVADGEQAWELLASTEVDLVVSDVDMPRLDGFDLTSRIRGSSKFAELPVVLVTARATDEDRTRGVQVGASGYLVKSGFDQTTLLEVIEQLI